LGEQAKAVFDAGFVIARKVNTPLKSSFLVWIISLCHRKYILFCVWFFLCSPESISHTLYPRIRNTGYEIGPTQDPLDYLAKAEGLATKQISQDMKISRGRVTEVSKYHTLLSFKPIRHVICQGLQ
jgi:hypothetical protein